MPKIKKLSLLEAQKIAAGEVVERPANVLKELIENALDAGATAITIYIDKAGQQRIQVIDNGCGMDESDAITCFEQYATSKITSVQDLMTLNTFGFRGEALASIAAVSSVQLTTREQSADCGLRFDYHQQRIINKTVVPCNSGTDIAITDLFYNVPARKKFLKSEATELRAITQLFQAYCLAHLSVHFQLYSDTKQLYNCPRVTTLQERCTQLWDHSMAHHMLPLNDERAEHYAVQGIISNHQWFRYDRSQIFFFVNGRWIKNQNLGKALLKGYANVLPTDRFCSAVVHITVPCAQVDINIHPRKEEVQFLHPRIIEQAITQTTKQVLEQALSAQLSQAMHTKSSLLPPLLFTSFEQSHTPSPMAASPAVSFPTSTFNTRHIHTFASTPVAAPVKVSIPQRDEQLLLRQELEPIEQLERFSIIGNYNNTYIIIEHEHGLMLIDQHAAHERILYERLQQQQSQESISLLFPLTITLTPSDCNELEPYLELLLEYELSIKRLSPDQLALYSTTTLLNTINMHDFFNELVVAIRQEQITKETLNTLLHHTVRAMIACKAAVKAGDVLAPEHMQQLLKDLAGTKDRFSCPHGRPTSWLIPLGDIEKKFKRNYQ